MDASTITKQESEATTALNGQADMQLKMIGHQSPEASRTGCRQAQVFVVDSRTSQGVSLELSFLL